jgi:hypothetical protein
MSGKRAMGHVGIPGNGIRTTDNAAAPCTAKTRKSVLVHSALPFTMSGISFRNRSKRGSDTFFT